MEYLINYPNGFYTEQARRMYRTFALWVNTSTM
jgi:hypothetical protein